jgi:hypothetical protein
MRNGILAVAVLALVLLLTGFWGTREEVKRARAAAAAFQGERDSLLTVVHRRNEEKAVLERERAYEEAAANRLRDSVTALERRRAEAQLGVRRLRTTGDLQRRLRSTFPELGDSGWGLTTVPLDNDTLGLEYLMVPAFFAETFIIDHANAESWREQRHQLLAVDSLRLLVTALQDSVTRLVAANASAYELGYDAAYAGYQDLSDRYVAELRKPRLRLPSALGLLGAAGVGLVIGRSFDE